MKKENKYSGVWRISEMENWDQDFIDLVVDGNFRFLENGTGTFEFGCVYGKINYKIKSKLEFSWEGYDEHDEANGHGWCQIKNINEIEGHLYFHGCDDSSFKCKRL